MSTKQHFRFFSRLTLQFNNGTCPYCHRHSVRREKRHGILQRVICSTLGVRPYHCYDCGHIHYSRSAR